MWLGGMAIANETAATLCAKCEDIIAIICFHTIKGMGGGFSCVHASCSCAKKWVWRRNIYKFFLKGVVSHGLERSVRQCTIPSPPKHEVDNIMVLAKKDVIAGNTVEVLNAIPSSRGCLVKGTGWCWKGWYKHGTDSRKKRSGSWSLCYKEKRKQKNVLYVSFFWDSQQPKSSRDCVFCLLVSMESPNFTFLRRAIRIQTTFLCSRFTRESLTPSSSVWIWSLCISSLATKVEFKKLVMVRIGTLSYVILLVVHIPKWPHWSLHFQIVAPRIEKFTKKYESYM